MELSLERDWKILSKNILLIIAAAVVGLICFWGVTALLIPEQYTASSRLYVQVGQTTTTGQNASINDLNYAQKVVKTYIEMLNSHAFFDKIQEKNRFSYTNAELKKMTTYAIVENTEIFDVKVTSRVPVDSQKIANAIAGLAPEYVNTFNDHDVIKVIDSAGLPTKPSSPDVVLNSIIGFILGLIISIVYVLLREVLDVRIKSTEDLEEKYMIPVLGTIPKFNAGSKGGKK